MKNSVKNTKGVITVLVSLMLVGALSVGTLVLEAGRYQSAKTQLTEANTSAASSMLAAYNGDLYDRYGLLAIDKKRFTSQRAADYLIYNSDAASGYYGNKISRLYSLDSVELIGMYNLTYTSVLKRQLLSRAKYHVAAQDHALNLYTYSDFFADFQNKCLYIANRLEVAAEGNGAGQATDIPEDMKKALSELHETMKDLDRRDTQCDTVLNGNTTAILPSLTRTVESGVPNENTDGSGDMLDSAQSGEGNTEIDVEPELLFVADIEKDLNDAYTANETQKAINTAKEIRRLMLDLDAALNTLDASADENLLLNLYISEYFSNRNTKVEGSYSPDRGAGMNGVDNAGFVSACVEYVIGASGDEGTNQEIAYTYTQAIRLVSNLYAVMTSSNCFDEDSIYSVAAHIAWANYESIADTELAAGYNLSVPLYKNDMLLPVNEPQSVYTAFSEHDLEKALEALGHITVEITYDEIEDDKKNDWEEGNTQKVYTKTVTLDSDGGGKLSYGDSLLFALWFVPNSEKLYRVADLIQLEMRYKEEYVDHTGASFLMSEQNTYCRVKTTGKFNSILPVLSFNAGQSVSGANVESVRYAGY